MNASQDQDIASPSQVAVSGHNDASEGSQFRYEHYDLDPETRSLTYSYTLGSRRFVERVDIEINEPYDEKRWLSDEADTAARLVFLLAGVSYYKTTAPPVIDLGATPVSYRERRMLRSFYVDGLGEFAYKNKVNLSGLRIVGGLPAPRRASPPGATTPADPPRVLIPFGGGMDSVLSTEVLRKRADAALLLVGLQGTPFAAMEPPARATGLPINRANRTIDSSINRSTRLGFMKGHIPINGIISAIAILVAVLTDRDGVALSNESSASDPTLIYQGRKVNHQYSKSVDFETALQGVISEAADRGVRLPDYFSSLRHRGDLSIARSFAELRPEYHRTFRSCNEAFHIFERLRLDHWCGLCAKCCFKDLILAPFMPAVEVRRIFDGDEPLDNPDLIAMFRSLMGVDGAPKPFDCVGEPAEARAAVRMAAERADRRQNVMLQSLLQDLAHAPTLDPTSSSAPATPPVVPARYAYVLDA